MRGKATGIISAVFVAEVTATFESAMIMAALPTLIRTFGDPISAGWLVTIHGFVGAIACVLAGRLGDIFGRRRAMFVILAIAIVGSIISAVSSNFALVLAGRALQGFSIAALPLTIGILRESLPPARMPVAVGLMTTAQGVGVAAGLVLGGAIVDQLSWHWLFVASAMLLLLSIVLLLLFVPGRAGTPPSQPIDWVEGLLPVPAIGALLLGISLSKEFGWIDTRVLGLLALGFALVAAIARRSLRSTEPFIDLRLLGQHNVAVANATSVLLALGTLQLVFVFSTYMQAPSWTMAGLGFSATVAGLAKLPSNFLSFFAGPVAGWLMDKQGARLPMMLGAFLATAGWLAALAMPSTLAHVVVLLCVVSFGTSVLSAAVPNVIVAAVPESRTSEAIGTNSGVRGMFAAIGAQIIAVWLVSDTVTDHHDGAAFPSAAAFQLAMVWIAILTAAAGACAFLLDRRSPKPKALAPRHPSHLYLRTNVDRLLRIIDQFRSQTGNTNVH